MLGGRWLLDTNAAIALLGRSPEFAGRLKTAEELILPLAALAEIEFGARNSANREANLSAIERLLKEAELLLPDRGTAGHYGDILVSLRRKGRPIPTNDLWIAALAIQHDLPLVTRDSHFREIDGLTIMSW